jgi:ABC-type branched-subunit amino acid transport system ATPase component
MSSIYTNWTALIHDIGRGLQVIKMQNLFKLTVDRIIAQVQSAEHKLQAVIATFERIIIMAFNQKLAAGALSTDVLNQIVTHINDIST